MVAGDTPTSGNRQVTPVATYRIQLTPDFGFADVITILPRLADLGISHLYLSPIATAMAGSQHGYDWVPTASPESNGSAVAGVADSLGGIDGLRALSKAARKRRMGIIVDIVPNHMGIADAAQNPWWADVLRHGRDSAYAEYFDLDFSPLNGAQGKIALPVLASDGDLSPLRLDDAGNLVYHDKVFPTAPGTADDTDPTSVHGAQHYRLVPHDSGLIGYRRFFAVNELAGLRQEDPEVYYATHQWVIDLYNEGLIDGVRVDHPDGLANPIEYLHQLRSDLGPAALIFVEKVLAPTEELDSWLPVDGTTGYDQLRIIDAVFVSEAGLVELTEQHEMFTGQTGDAQWLHDTGIALKKHTLAQTFRAEHARLVRAIRAAGPDLGLAAGPVFEATGELISTSLFYREDYPGLLPYYASNLASLATIRPDLATAITVIADATASPGEPTGRLAQTTGAVTAKSVEDCLFYRTARLVSSQEVGCDPGHATLTLAEFHELNARRLRTWPMSMSTSSTHDTKRGEDVRARIRMLSQIPQRWMGTVIDIYRRHAPPDPLTALFLLQNIFGIWPDDGQPSPQWFLRIHAYAIKAMREAGLHTSWTSVNADFEDAMSTWINDATTGESADALTALTSEVDAHWHAEALAHKAITLLAPGIPDIYQGTQWWEDSLVDPDNRRPVDYTQSAKHPKSVLITTALRLRAAHPDAFGTDSSYIPLFAEGPGGDRIIAFGRGTAGSFLPDVVLVTARFTHSFGDEVRSATSLVLPEGDWVDAASRSRFSGAPTIGDLLSAGPVALLVRNQARSRRR
ncbi:malto-oligosyl trehalose synthase [Gordonia effusa NBRC 100432]|uniref:Malto-oligosyl trehalose synthase n=1 Tax=Gordonia effusa NBRC 100432 TaxID=1077974 RepID=H0R162_9ACTN|nr:malto-oligosyltrehalose synthase [Gordonia effusa]GAB18813.1 malto-oligosyl trehalose synthase [Gordonia effusa NBRC 100432]